MGQIVVAGLTKVYKNVRAVDDLSFTVEPGEKATPPNVDEAATEAAWSSRINPTDAINRSRIPQRCWEPDMIMLFRTQKTCGTERSNLI